MSTLWVSDAAEREQEDARELVGGMRLVVLVMVLALAGLLFLAGWVIAAIVGAS